MDNRFFNVAVSLSAVAFCLFVIAWFAASNVDPCKQFASISSGCHLSVDARDADARLVVFSDPSYGLYSGSIIGIAGDPNGPNVYGIGDVAGIYFRMVRWPDGKSLWTLSLSLVYPLLASLVLPVVWLIGRARQRGRGFPVEAK